MTLLTDAHRARLAANAVARASGTHDPVPVVKFFNPAGAATWLVTELDTDGDTMFGLADLGFGCPELGYFSLAEIEGVRLAFGLSIERDIGFSTTHSLSIWADTARSLGSIQAVERALIQPASPKLPPGRPEG